MMQILLYSDDIALVEYWQSVFDQRCTVIDDVTALDTVRDAIVVISFIEGCQQCIVLLERLVQNGNRVLVLQRVPDFLTAKQFMRLGIKGYGNALMRDHFLVAAVEALQEGMVWLHPEFTSQLIMQMDGGQTDETSTYLERLSEREKEVALLLKEGDIYKVIAEKLNITPRTVKAHAQNIYIKLNVKDRLGLALLLK